MKLSDDAHIPLQKIAGYLLQLRPESDKAKYLMSGGYTLDLAERLMEDIRRQLLSRDAMFMHTTEYGDMYEIRGELLGPTGIVLHVVSIWMRENHSGQTKFITLFPDKGRKV